MRARIGAALLVHVVWALAIWAAPAEAKRVALVIGQDDYTYFTELHNSRRDARMVAGLLAKHGFEVLTCGGTEPGCHNLDRGAVLGALERLEAAAKGAETALVYFAGHGLASEEGNILTPVDATVNCATGAITNGVPVERLMEATAPAGNKLVILDACRNNPIGKMCPNLAGKKLSFTRIEAGALQGFLLVTSTQFGQVALDGPKGANSPFATALLAKLEANPSIHFEQVMNEVGRATYDAAQKMDQFQQIPGKVVGTPAPADCLAGRACVGDPRMAALAQENEKLTADAAAVRNILADEERSRGKPYTAEERQAAIERIGRSLTSLAGSAEPKVKEATRLFGAGKVAEGKAKLDEALDDDEKAAAEIERLAKERRKALARNARDAAALARGTDVAKALVYYERATRNDPDDANTWDDYARAAVDAGRLDVAKAAFERAALAARDSDQPRLRYWATLGLGDVARAQGSLPSARRLYETARAIVEPLATVDPGNAGWQRDLSVAHDRIGDVLRDQGNLPAALEAYRAGLAIAERLATADPGNAGWQRDLSVSHNKVGDVLRAQGNLPAALEAYRASLAIRERLATADPGNAGWQRDVFVSLWRVADVAISQGRLPDALLDLRRGHAIVDRLATADPGNAQWQRDLSFSHNKVGDVLRDQGNLPAAREAFRAALAIAERLATADPGNAGWQRDLSVSHTKIGDVLRDQGNLAAALEAYRAALAIAERLATADPGNAEWQRDVFVSLWRVANVAISQGRLPDALLDLRRGHAIVERLATADPGNAGWQRDLAVSNERIGDMHARSGETKNAIAAFERALAAYRGLMQRNPGDMPSRVYSVVPLWRLGVLKGKDGRDDLIAARAILKELAESGRLDAMRTRWIPQIEAQIADLEKAR